MRIKHFCQKLFAAVKALGSLTPIALLTAGLPVAGSSVLLLFVFPLGTWLRDNWEVGTPLFLLGTLLFCGLSLLPTNVLGLLSGWIFSFDLGIAILISGIVGAALISFLIHSRFTGDKLPRVFGAYPKAKVIYEALIGQSVWRTTLIIFLLRLSPLMPFALTNFLMASARVPIRSFLIGTFFGMLPRSSAVVLVGAGLSELTLDSAQDRSLMAAGLAATIVSILFIGKISKSALERLAAQHQSA